MNESEIKERFAKLVVHKKLMIKRVPDAKYQLLAEIEGAREMVESLGIEIPEEDDP